MIERSAVWPILIQPFEPCQGMVGHEKNQSYVKARQNRNSPHAFNCLVNDTRPNNDKAFSRWGRRAYGLALRTIFSTIKVVGNDSTDKFFPFEDLERSSVRLFRTHMVRAIYEYQLQGQLTNQVITSLLRSSDSMRCNLAGKLLPALLHFK